MADISAKIKLDGEAAFKRAMNDATRATKSLETQLNLAAQDFKDTGNAEAYMQQKGELLNQKLTQQKKAVETAKKALEKFKQDGLDENSVAVIDWKTKLAQAEAQVNETTKEINNNKKGLDKAGNSYKTAGDKARTMGTKVDGAETEVTQLNTELKNVGKGIAWQNVTDGISRINSAVDNGIRKVTQWGKQLWNMAVDSTVWADDLATLSAQTGIDTTMLQQWNYAARFIDTDVSAIISARNRLTKSMTSSGLEETLSGYGLATRQSNGELRDSYDLMWDVLGLLGRMENETERDNLAMEVFGRSATELMPLIKAGREEWERVGGEAPIVSEENVNRLTEANDKIEQMNARLETMKTTLLAELAPVLGTISDAITTAVDKLDAYLQTPEGKQLLEDLSNAAVNLVSSLVDIDWDEAIRGAASALSTVKDALQWVIDNKQLVLGALEVLAGARIFGILANAAVNVGKLGSGIDRLLGIGGGASGAGAGAGGGGGTVVAAGAGKKLFGFMANPAVLGTAAGAAMMMAVAYAIGKKNVYSDQVYNTERYKDDPLNESIQRAAWMMSHGNGVRHGDGRDTAQAMTYLGMQSGNAADWLQIFDYQDAKRGASNFILDILNGVDLEAGDNKQLMASIYRIFAGAFGEIGTAAGDAALASLPPEAQMLLREGQGANQQLIRAGSAADDTALMTYMGRFFQYHGIDPMNMASPATNSQNTADAAAHGATTATWGAAEDLLTRGMKNGLVLTRPENIANGSAQAQDPAETAALLAAAIGQQKVEIDGKAAGTVIAPTVAQIIARSIAAR